MYQTGERVFLVLPGPYLLHFSTDLKVLPLACYDVILGMDWLEEHSPMPVNWKMKTTAFEYKGTTVKMQGVRHDIQQCSVISVHNWRPF